MWWRSGPRPGWPWRRIRLVGDDPPADRVQAAAEAARRAFQGLSRQGFDEALLDEAEHVEGFRVGAGALLAIGMQLEAFLGRIGAIDQATPDLEDWFELDRGVFRAQFAKIYGEVS